MENICLLNLTANFQNMRQSPGDLPTHMGWMQMDAPLWLSTSEFSSTLTALCFFEMRQQDNTTICSCGSMYPAVLREKMPPDWQASPCKPTWGTVSKLQSSGRKITFHRICELLQLYKRLRRHISAIGVSQKLRLAIVSYLKPVNYKILSMLTSLGMNVFSLNVTLSLQRPCFEFNNFWF